MNLCKELVVSPQQGGRLRAGWRVPEVSCHQHPTTASMQGTIASFSHSHTQLACTECQLYF